MTAETSGKFPEWLPVLIKVTVLTLVFIVAFASRLFAVIRFESIIHEFDPWSAARRMFRDSFVSLMPFQHLQV